MTVAPETLADRFDPKAVGRIVARHVPLLAACTALGLAAGWAYDRAQVPEFTATARLEVAPSRARVLSDLKLENEGEGLVRLLTTTKERLRSRVLSERVAASLDMATEARLLEQGPSKVPNGFGSPTQPTTLAGLIEASEADRVAQSAAALRSGLAVETIRGTNLMKLRFTHSDADLAAHLANAIATSYVDMERDRLRDAASRTSDLIETQLAAAAAELKASESELVRFVADSKLSIGADGEPTQESGVSSLRNALAQATTERVIAERRLRQMKRDGIETLPAAFAHPGVQRARTKAGALRAEYRERRARMKPDFPLMRSIKNRITGYERDMQRELELVARAVRAEVRQAKDREASLRAEVEVADDRVRVARQAAVGYSAFKRRVDANRSRYANLAGKISEVSVSAALVEPRVRITEAATVPNAAANANFWLHLLAGLVGFLSIGAGAIVVRETLRDEFDSPEDLASETGVPVIATVPQVGIGRLTRAENNPASGLREAYRYLRASLANGALAGTGRVLLVTGVSKGAGASSAARRLALDLAALERRVLLIDADFRSGEQHAALGISNAAGLTDLLDWGAGTDVSSCFQKAAGGALTVLPTGPSSAEAGDRLASQRTERMLALLRKSFDVIVIDAAPILSRADATVLSVHADATLLVARRDRTKRTEVQAAMVHLREAGARVIGAVFTRYERRSFQRAMLSQARSPFDALRELVPESKRGTEPNRVHDMLSSAEAAMSDRKAA